MAEYCEEAKAFKETIANLDNDVEFLKLSPRKQQIYRDALQGEIDTLESQRSRRCTHRQKDFLI